MDKRFLSAEYFDLNHKLTRAASFSELSTSKKCFEKCSQVETNGNLVKQYSSERILDDRSDIRHSMLLQFTSDREQYSNIWKSGQADKTPTYIPKKNFGWPTGGGTKQDVEGKSSSTTKYSTVPKLNRLKMKSILAPPRLNFDNGRENETKENVGRENQNSITVGHSLSESKQPSVKEEFKKPVLPLKKKKSFVDDNVLDAISNKNRNISENLSKSAAQVNSERESTEFSSDYDLQKRLQSLNAGEQEKKRPKFRCRCIMIVLLLSLAAAYSGFMWSGVEISDKLCNPRFYFKNIPEELRSHIHGQDSAVSSLIHFFEKQDGKSGFEIIALIGGIGVGKSYAAEIIKRNVERSVKVLDLYSPVYRKEEWILSSLAICRCNLIRLENLRTDDIPDVVNFASNIRRRAENYCILILALFNTQETDLYLKKTIDLEKSMSIVREQFHKVKLQPALISFNPMDDDALEKCIRDAANHADVELTNDEIEYVKRDLLNADSGCKGASAKVQIVGKRFRSTEL